jgi:hypothetical protein
MDSVTRRPIEPLEVRRLLSAYSLDGGTASQSDGNYTTSAAGTSGVAVYGGGSLTLTDPTVATTGDAPGDAAGTGAGVLAGNATTTGNINIAGGTVTTGGTDAAGVFATGSGSEVSLSNDSVTTTGDGATGVGAATAGYDDLDGVGVATQGGDAPALSATTGGTVRLDGGSATATGAASPAVYAAGNVNTIDASFSSSAAAAVVDGDGAFAINFGTMVGATDGVQAVDTASAGGQTATVTLVDAAVTAHAGDGVHVTGTTATVELANDTTFTDATGDAVHVDGDGSATVDVETDQHLAGALAADAGSTLSVDLSGATVFTGAAVNAVDLTVESGGTWDATGSSTVRTLDVTGTLAATATVSAGSLEADAGSTLEVDGTHPIVVSGGVALGSTLNVDAAGLAAGRYTLMTYGGSLSGTPAFTVTGLPSGLAGSVDTSVPGVVTVTLAAVTVVPPTPTLTASASTLVLYATTAGTAGSAAVIDFTGSNLTAGAAVTLSIPAGAEVSADGVYATTLPLAVPVGGTLSVDLLVRISASATTNVLGQLTMTDPTDGVAPTVAVSGVVYQATPFTVPSLAVSDASINLSSTPEGTAGATAALAVIGTGLSDAAIVTLTAPAGAEVASSVDPGTFSSSTTLTAASNGVLGDAFVYVRTAATATGDVSGHLTLTDPGDDVTAAVTVTGAVTAAGTATPTPTPTPSLSVGSALIELPPTVVGMAGDAVTIGIVGSGLTAGSAVTVTAPTGAELSLDYVTYTPVLTLTANSAGGLTGANVYVRIAASATADVSGNITIFDATDDAVARVATLGTATVAASTGPPALTLRPYLGAAPVGLASATAGTAGPMVAFVVGGTNLTAGAVVTVSAPAGVELSSDGSTYADTVSFTIPADLTLANTTLFARIAATATADIAGDITASDATDTVQQTLAVAGTVASATPTPSPTPTPTPVVVPPGQTVALSPGNGSRFRFVGADGAVVTVSFASPSGSATLTRSAEAGADGDVTTVVLAGTTAASRLTFATAHGQSTTVGSISDDNPFGVFDGPGVTVTGDVNLAAVSTVQVAALDDSTVTIGNAGRSVNLNVGQVNGSAITSGVAVRALTAASMTGSSLAAPAVGTLRVGAQLSDAVISVAGPIGTLHVGGAITGSTVSAGGDVGSVVAGSLATTVVNLGEAGGTVASATAGAVGALALGRLQLTGRTGSTFTDASVIAGRIGSAALGNVAADNGGAIDGVAAGSIRSLRATVGGAKIDFDAQHPAAVFGDFEIRIV